MATSGAMAIAIARQIKALASAPPDGVRYVPGDSLTEVLAEVDGPVGTPYEGGTFRVKLALGGDFPAAPPKGVFLTKIFHPNVSASGEICVNTLKKDWKPEHTLGHVLQVVHCLLIVPFPESSLNDDAGKLFMESYDEYARKARLWTGIHAKPSGAGAGDVGSSGAGAGAGAPCPQQEGGAGGGGAGGTPALLAAVGGKGCNVDTAAAAAAAAAAASGNALAQEKRKAVSEDDRRQAEGKKRALKRL